jgi:hypothetical protein
MIPLALAPAVGFLKRIPRAAWIALAVIAILALGTCAHKRSVKKFGEERYAAGVAYEAARIEKKAKAIAARAETIAATLRSQNNETNRRIAGDADTLRVSGPGKAACVSSATPGAGRRQPASGNGNAAGPQVPAGNGPALPELAAVPWPWLVNRAEQCDLNRAEVLTWREWHRLLVEDWEKQN